MKNCTIINAIVAMGVGWSVVGCGQPTYKSEKFDEVMGAATYLKDFEESALDSDYMNRDVIEVQDAISLDARKDLNGRSQPFSFQKGDSMTVLKRAKDVSGKEFVQIYLEDESQSSDVQEVVWLPVEALSSDSFEVVEMEDAFDEYGMEIDDGATESDPVMVAAKSKSKKKATKRKKKKKGMTYCYRFVKIRLQKLGLVKGYLPGGSAYMAAKHLPKHGFKRTSRGIKNARTNDVCVYSGGPQGHGHIEMRTAGGWWYGYGVKSSPMSGRRFIACFSKG